MMVASSVTVSKSPTSQPVMFLKRYSTHFGVRPNNIITEKKARAHHAKGETFAVIVGDPEGDDYHYVELYHSIDPFIDPGMSVYFVQNGVEVRKFHLKQVEDPPEPGNDTFIYEHVADFRDAEGRRGHFHLYRAFGVGDLPQLEFNREVWYDVSVPWQDFFVGPFPSFDELIDGSLVARLPKITMPPEHLLVEYMPHKDRTEATPKRVPKGRFPWGLLH